MKILLDPVTRIDLDETFKEYDKKNRAYRNQILKALDKVVKELETMREENSVGAYQARELKKNVENHEKRIIKIEETLAH